MPPKSGAGSREAAAATARAGVALVCTQSVVWPNNLPATTPSCVPLLTPERHRLRKPSCSYGVSHGVGPRGRRALEISRSGVQ